MYFSRPRLSRITIDLGPPKTLWAFGRSLNRFDVWFELSRDVLSSGVAGSSRKTSKDIVASVM